MDVGNVVGFLWRRRKADLGGPGEIFQNFAPCRILGRATTVTLVDDDQIEEARRKLPEQFLAFLWPGDGLISPR